MTYRKLLILSAGFAAIVAPICGLCFLIDATNGFMAIAICLFVWAGILWELGRLEEKICLPLF